MMQLSESMLAPLARYTVEIKYITLSAIVLPFFIYLQSTQAFGSVDSLIRDAINLFTSFGLVGIFFLALAANSAVIIQIPYTIPLLLAAINGANFEEMLSLGTVAGVGAGIGKCISYTIADRLLALNHNLKNSRFYRWVERNVEKYPRATPFIILLWTSSPIPDDTVIVPLAMIRYGLRRLWLPVSIGKLAHNIGVAMLFLAFTSFSANQFSQDGQTQSSVIMLIMIALLILLFYQVEKSRANTKIPTS